MRRILVMLLLLGFVLPLSAEKILLMSPFNKGIEKSDVRDIEKKLKKIFKKKYKFITEKQLQKQDKKLLRKLKKCKAKSACWSEYTDDADEVGFQYAFVSLIKTNEDDEVVVKFYTISLEDEEVVGRENRSFEDIDDISIKKLWPLVNSANEEIKDDISKKKRKSSRKDSSLSERRRREENERKKEARERRLREEEERREKLEEERRRREEELERKRELDEERRRKKEEARRRKKEDERRRRKAEKKRLERERERREEARRKKAEKKKVSLEKNAENLEKARKIVLRMCSDGKYKKAINAIMKVEKVKCECEEDAKVLALKTQLLSFYKVVTKIQEGVKLKNYSLILDNLEAAISLDQEIVDGGTEFSNNVDQYYAMGYYSKAMAMEKDDDYVRANEYYEKCIDKDDSRKECHEWLDSKDKLVKKLFDKAKIMKGFNPTKAKSLLRSILKLVTAEHDYYQKSEEELKKLEY